MDNKIKAKIIVDIIRERVASVTTQYIRAVAEQAGVQEGHNLWEKDPNNDLGWNPYNVDAAEKLVANRLEEKLAREEVLTYAIDVFLEKIPNQEENKNVL